MDWIPSWVWWVIGLVILREVFAVVFGWDSPWFGETFKNAKYNRELYKSGRANEKIKVSKTVGWRRSPFYGNDGFTPDPGNSRTDKKGKLDTPSGNYEYYRVIEKGKK